jgi:rare lipoprotein A
MLFVSVAALLCAIAPASAGDVKGTSAEVQTLEERLAKLLDESYELDTKLRIERRQRWALQRERRRSWRVVSRRITAIYKADGVGHLGRDIFGGEDAVELARVRHSTIGVVVDHDERLLARYSRVSARLAKLERSIERAERRLVKIGQSTHELRERLLVARKALKRARAKARQRARMMARVPDVPLVTRATSAEQAAAQTAAGSRVEEAPPPPVWNEHGIASIYAESFHGERTSSGEPLDLAGMTAAHRTLPLGTWVLVRGPGGTALLRITDRGPFIAGRIIDLTPAAAAAVGVTGLGEVSISVQN